jgi:multidrug resistance efflux pump
MSGDFVRTFRELEADSPSGSILLWAAAASLIAAWCGWLFWGRVTIYTATDKARLEIISRVYPVEATVAGRVNATHLALDQKVHSGDVLVLFDSETEERRLEEDKARLAAIVPELAKLNDEINTEDKSLSSEQRAAEVAVDQLRVQWRGDRVAWRIADDIAKRYVAAGDSVSPVNVLRQQADAGAKRAAADDAQLEIAREQRDEQTRESDRAAHIEQREQDRTRLDGERQTTHADIKSLEYEIEKRSIRAPVSGRVASVAELEVGTFVQAGERLATIVPAGKIRAVAEFDPSESLGRIEFGQRAWLHLSGFPWTQYGSVSATVASVASEPREGRIRVELDLDPKSAPLIPLQHGLPGTAEIEVEHLSPATLIMRAAGRLMTRPRVSQVS